MENGEWAPDSASMVFILLHTYLGQVVCTLFLEQSADYLPKVCVQGYEL